MRSSFHSGLCLKNGKRKRAPKGSLSLIYVHTRIQTMRTPSGVRFVFVYISHAPRSCMIGQQGSFGRAEHAHVPLAKLCLSSCTVGNAREKGGLLFLFL